MMRHLHFLACGLLMCACDPVGTPVRPEQTGAPGSLSDGGGSGPGQAVAADAGIGDQLKRSTRSSLQWKRYATFENDLAAALELAPDALCKEFGVEPCVRGVHLGPLGGHDIRTGLLESPGEPLVTTPSVVERVVLSACLARVEKERAEGSKVFAGVDLASAAPAPSSEGANALVSGLVRRFLARDPVELELEVLGSLARDAQGQARPAAVFASSVCLALGSSTEFLFF